METTITRTLIPPAIRATRQIHSSFVWQGPEESVLYSEEGARSLLLDFDHAVYVVQSKDGVGITEVGQFEKQVNSQPVLYRGLASLPLFQSSNWAIPPFALFMGQKLPIIPERWQTESHQAGW